MKKKFICPNCYREVKCQDVQFRCTEPFCDAKEADERYQRYLLSITNDTNNFDTKLEMLTPDTYRYLVHGSISYRLDKGHK